MLAEAQEDEKLQERAHNCSGHAYYCLEAPDQAMQCYQQGLSRAEQKGNAGAQCRAWACVANCWYMKGDLENAARYALGGP